MSLARNMSFSCIQIIIGLHSFVQTRVFGSFLSIIANAYAHMIILDTFCIVVSSFQS